MDEKIDQMQKMISDLIGILGKTNSMISELKTELKADIAELRTGIAELKSDIEDAKATVDLIEGQNYATKND